MKDYTKALAVALLFAVSFVFLVPELSLAAEDQEHRYGNTIYDRYWVMAEFPLKWYLHQGGVINNNAVGAGTADVSNADAATELEQAFAAWEGVATANISFTNEGETTTGTTGCDRENIITWSDTSDFTSRPDLIARGITTRYSGPPITLNDTNRSTITCSGGGTVALDSGTYPNGTLLIPGTLLDMDMSFNSANKDFVTTANATFGVADIESTAVHEFGHMISLAHVSLPYTSTSHRATMYPEVSTASITSQTDVKSLELDDQLSVSRRYPSAGFWPTGTAPYTTGALSGNVLQADGTAAQGIRVWAYETTDTTHPIAEVYTATDHDWDASLSAGDYTIPGLPPGKYYVCIVPWNNGVGSDDPSGNTFNRTASDYNIDTFNTECFDDAVSSVAAPEFDARTRVVTVEAGQTTPNINFVTGTEQSDVMLVMDRSGSMTLDSGTNGVTKIQALKSATNQFVDYLKLAAGHRLGLVQFEEVLVPLTPVFDLQPLDALSVASAHSAISSMSAGGWTNIIAGVEEGLDQLSAVVSPNPRQVIVLFSDGKHNRPVGSDLSTINDMVVDNDVRFYSIGFGTDVDDAILADVASNSGGVHVNEQDLDALSLTKHFMAIGASAIDETLVVDPRYSVGPGEKASLDVSVSDDDKSITFAVSWVTKDKNLMGIKVRPPGAKCIITNRNNLPGVKSVAEENYSLIRVQLPFRCGSRDVSKGKWRITALGTGIPSGEKEDVEILIINASGIRLFTDAVLIREGAFITAKLVRKGVVLKEDAKVYAEVLPPAPPTFDSGGQDAHGKKYEHKKSVPARTKPVRKMLVRNSMESGDNGTANFYSGLVKPKEPGLYRVRIVAEFWLGGQRLTREALQTFYYSGPRSSTRR